MDARRWSLPVALLSIALGAPACGGVYARVPVGAAVRVPMAPPGVFVDDDVADGYVAFAAELAPWGRWEGDPTYGVHWCPARTAGAYRPYASGGHWATSDQAEYGSPSGTVTWVDDGGPEWRAVTSHRGWWIDRGANDWCWVPGGSETPARVVWRTGDDFVGWAPEPPSWEDDGDECDDAGFEWSFELLGTLLEDTTDGYTLAGDDARLAATDTSPSQRAAEGGPTFSRRAPAKPVVDAAHGRLADFVGAHEHQLANAGKAGSHASSSSSSSSSSHSGHFTAKNDDDGHADLPVGRMPPAAAMMGVMQTEPAGGGGGFLHGGSPYASGGGGRGGWSGGATGAWGSSNAGSNVASASSGGGSHHNHASAGHTSRGGGSSSHHHGGGGSHHVSSSHHR